MSQKGALFFFLYMGPSTKNVTSTIGVIVSTTIAPITITKSLELSRFVFFHCNNLRWEVGGRTTQPLVIMLIFIISMVMGTIIKIIMQP